MFFLKKENIQDGFFYNTELQENKVNSSPTILFLTF